MRDEEKYLPGIIYEYHKYSLRLCGCVSHAYRTEKRYGSVVLLLSVHVLVASVLSQQLHCLPYPTLVLPGDGVLSHASQATLNPLPITIRHSHSHSLTLSLYSRPLHTTTTAHSNPNTSCYPSRGIKVQRGRDGTLAKIESSVGTTSDEGTSAFYCHCCSLKTLPHHLPTYLTLLHSLVLHHCFLLASPPSCN